MKKILLLLLFLILNALITFAIIYVFVLSKTVLIEEGMNLEKNIEKDEAKIILDKKSKLFGDIHLKSGEIIFKESSYLKGNIYLEKGKIKVEKDVIIDGNIDFDGTIILGESSKINGNISKKSNLEKHSTSTVLGEKPNLFVTTDYPSFMKYFDALPENHKNKFGYIFLTSHNMDIRGDDLEPKKYFKNIFYYENSQLKEVDIGKNQELLEKMYKNSKNYIEKLSEKKVGRFGVGFVTKSGAFDKKRADMYISSSSANPVLFMHEYGHIMDYAKNYIDYHNPKYPYFKKENSITEYGKYHPGEDFAEGYRFYVLHNKSFKSMTKDNDEITKKYKYFKKYVFDNLEYN